MSNTDSFIEEVTEEVRRDRIFVMMRKYGWIGVVAVAAIVGGTAWSEYQKSTERALAQANGDALVSALENNEAAERTNALQSAELQGSGANVVRAFLVAAQQLETGDRNGAAATLDGISNGGDEVSDIYVQLASLKAASVREGGDPAARRTLLEAMAQPGQPLALLASEQVALMDVAEGNTDAALTRLEAIRQDAEVTVGLRRRASQLIVALGGTPAELPTTLSGQ